MLITKTWKFNPGLVKKKIKVKWTLNGISYSL